jgi:predicted phosphodiesterase
MIIKFLTDTHFNAPHSLDEQLKYAQVDYYLGDIYDTKNTLKENFESAVKEEREFFAKNFDKYLNGNHDGILGADTYKIIIANGQRVLLCHNYEFLNEEIWKQYYNEKCLYKGIGKLRWNALKFFHKHFGNGNLSKQNIDDAAELALGYNCQVIIFGHVHPKETVDTFSGKVRVVCLRRGSNYVEI